MIARLGSQVPTARARHHERAAAVRGVRFTLVVHYLGYVVELGGVRAYHAGDCLPHRGFPGDLAAYVAQSYPQLTILTFGRGGRLATAASAVAGLALSVLAGRSAALDRRLAAGRAGGGQ